MQELLRVRSERKELLQPRYDSVAISGPPGAGRSTLLKNLKPLVSKWGWDTFSGGEWARQVAIGNGKHKQSDLTHHSATDYGDNIDRQIDVAVRLKLRDKANHVLVESWIAGWNMRGIPHVLKVLLVCPEELRIDRVVNRDHLTVKEAKRHLEQREKLNFDKWERMYHVRDFWNPKYYDLVINTYFHSAEEVRDMVVKKLCFRH